MTETMRSLLVGAERHLDSVGVPSPRADAEALLCHVLGVTRGRLLLSAEVEEETLAEYRMLVDRRRKREPLQHIVGTAAFRRLELAVGPGVFVPRPETELVAEAAIRALRTSKGRLAVDLGAGSGAAGLSLALEVPGATVHLVESDPGAFPWLRRNVEAHADALEAVGSTAVVHEADVRSWQTPALDGRVDVVVTNPPYVPDDAVPRDVEVRDYDPPAALYGGDDGMALIRPFIDVAARLLAAGGALVVEHGDEQGVDAPAGGVPGIIAAGGHFTAVVDRVDLAGRQRFTMAIRETSPPGTAGVVGSAP